MSNFKSIYLRKELNNLESRTILTPNDISELIHLGWTIYVQKSSYRIYSNDQYKKVGCELTDLPWSDPKFNNCLILGLKQFDNLHLLNSHSHVYFSHSYQNQQFSEIILRNFISSNSILFDLEYFLDYNNSRLVSFGFWAGVVGTGLAILEFCQTTLFNNSIKNLTCWDNYGLFFNLIYEQINLLDPKIKSNIKIALCGPNGNCGRGAQNILNELNLPFTKISKSDSKEILTSFDIVINCIKLSPKSQEIWFNSQTKFINPIIISDISCDCTKPNNPIQLYNECTTWIQPILKPYPLVKIISIDNLPSLLPKESSKYFSSLFVNILKQYPEDPNNIWKNNLNIYKKKIKNL